MGEESLRNAISRSSASFRNLNSDLHMVLFFDRCVFDYIPTTRELRSYNSGYWVKMKEGGEYDCILEFLKVVYDQLKKEDLSNDYIIYGFVMDSIIAIDLDKVLRYLKTMERVDKIVKGLQDPPKWYSSSCNHDILFKQCEDLKDYLDREYRFWEGILRGALINHEHIVDIMKDWDDNNKYMDDEENEYNYDGN